MSQRLPSPLGLSMSYIFGWTPGLVDTLKPFRAWRLLDQLLLIHEALLISRSPLASRKMYNTSLSSCICQANSFARRVADTWKRAAGDDPSPEGFGPQGEESRSALFPIPCSLLSIPYSLFPIPYASSPTIPQ